MVKVLVFGAAGYIGSATSLALSRAGHSVVGVTRKDSFPELEQGEVEVVQGNINELKALASHIEAADVVIDNVMDFGPKGPNPNANVELLAAVEAASKKSGAKKRYIYTSGILVYESSPGQVVSETHALAKGPYLQERIKQEQRTLKSTEVVGVVIRPGFVYGGKSDPVSAWFQPNDKGEWCIDGNADRCLSFIHNEDLAELYVRLVEASASTVGGEAFNAGDDTRVTYGQARTLLARAAGFKGEMTKIARGSDFLSMIGDVSVVVSYQKAKTLLGWVPKHGPFPDNAHQTYRAWKAWHPSKK